MFKKTLVALAITSMSTLASAGNFSIANTDVALEGNLAATGGAATLTNADLAAIVTRADASYVVNDVVTFTVSGAVFDTTVTPAATVAQGGAAGVPTTTLTFLDYSTSSTVRFRVTTADSAALNDITLTTYTLDTTGAVDEDEIEFSATAISANPAIGNYDASAATVAATFLTQYTSANTLLDGTIDVANGRKQFEAAALTDDFVVTPTITADLDAITVATITHVLKGTDLSFAWDYDAAGAGNGTLSQAELSMAFPVTFATDDTFTSSLNAAMDTLTIVQIIAGGAADVMTVTPTVKAAQAGSVLAPQTFTLVSTAANAGAAIAIPLASKSAGQWKLNGANVTVPYMPFGDNTQVIARATNSGNVSGGFSVRYMLEGVNTTWVDLGELTTISGGVTDVAPIIVDAVKADAGVVKGKVALDITVNVPTDKFTLYAAYKVLSESDRGFVGTFGVDGSANN